MDWIRYWRQALRRAWWEAWRIVITHNLQTIVRDLVLLLVALGLLFWFGSSLVARGYMSGDNPQDTLIWILVFAVALVALFSATFLIEGLFVVPFKMWREEQERANRLDAAIERYSQPSSPDLMSKIQSGEWEIAMPPKDDGPNWPLRELFCYIEPSLAEHHDPLVARDVGQDVLDKLSTMQLSAYGRPDSGSGRRPLVYIPHDFWTRAEFTYWFLNGEEGDDHRYLVHAKTEQPNGVLGTDHAYRDIQVNRREAMQIWRKKPEARSEGGGPKGGEGGKGGVDGGAGGGGGGGASGPGSKGGDGGRGGGD